MIAEREMSLAEVSRALPGRPHVGTVLRWIRRGVTAGGRKVRLRARKAGWQWYVRPSDLDAFRDATSQAKATRPPTPDKRKPARQGNFDRAMAALAAEGLMGERP